MLGCRRHLIFAAAHWQRHDVSQWEEGEEEASVEGEEEWGFTCLVGGERKGFPKVHRETKRIAAWLLLMLIFCAWTWPTLPAKATASNTAQSHAGLPHPDATNPPVLTKRQVCTKTVSQARISPAGFRSPGPCQQSKHSPLLLGPGFLRQHG